MRRLLSLFRRQDPHVPLSDVLIETRKKLAQDTEIKPPRVVYATPERDSEKKGCTHEWSDNDVVAMELKQQGLREFNASKVVSIRIGSVR